MKCLSVAVLLFLLSFNALSLPYKLSGLNETVYLEAADFQVFEDTTRAISFEKVKELADSAFIQLHYYKNLEADYWLKYTFVNDTDKNGNWVLEIIDPHINHIAFYGAEWNNGINQGFLQPFNKRLYKHKNHVFEVSIAKGDTAIYYIHLVTTAHVSLTTKLQTHPYFSAYSLNEYFYLGVFYGFLIIMAVYNIILYFFTRMRTRIYYALYVFGAVLNSFTEDGLGFQYVWPSVPLLNDYLAHFQPIIYLVFYTIYAMSFLDLVQKSTVFKKVLVGYVALYSIGHLIGVFFNLTPKIWLLFYFVPFALVLYYAAKQYLHNKQSMRFLFLGTALILINFVIFYFRVHGLVENSIYVVYFFNFAVVIEILMFSIAMGEKLRASQIDHLKDKELVIEGLKLNEELNQKVNRELEEKVKERTQDLNEAKILLEQQAQAITEMNLRLDLSNRDLTKKVVEVAKKRVHGTEIDPVEFQELYPNKLQCFLLLEEIKWKEGFTCRKCSGDTFLNGPTFRSRRCTKCGTNETPTAHTVFHGIRIPIEKAFFVFALLIQTKGEVSTTELEKVTGVSQRTCWGLKQRVVERLKTKKKSTVSWEEIIYKE